MPAENLAGGPLEYQIAGGINYRPFNQEYTNYVLMARAARTEIPIVRMAEATVVLGTAVKGQGTDASASRVNAVDRTLAQS